MSEIPLPSRPPEILLSPSEAEDRGGDLGRDLLDDAQERLHQIDERLAPAATFDQSIPSMNLPMSLPNATRSFLCDETNVPSLSASRPSAGLNPSRSTPRRRGSCS
jgi:hypothetical protein